MQTEPIYKSVPTLRDYEEYKKAEQYTQGWNDAMHFIFDSGEEKQRLDQVRQIVNNWNNDASHSFEDMCKINKILKE